MEAAAVFSIVSGVVGAMGAMSAAQYQAQIANNNAMIAQQNAGRSRQEAAVEAQEQDIDAKSQIGAMLAEMGASGLSLGSGSLALRHTGASELAAKDRGYTIYMGETEAINFENQATQFKTEAKAAKSAGAFNALGSLIGGASGAARVFM